VKPYFEKDAPFWRLVPPLLALRLALYFMAFVLLRFTAGGPPGFWDNFLQLWSRWDVEHYVQIAEDGYVNYEPDAKNIAFFPMYPAIVAALHVPLRFLPTAIVGMLVSNVASIFALRFLYRLAKARFDEEVALRTVVYAAAFPTAYFFQVAYTEGLFFFFICAAFLALHEERWRDAALWGACASATRLTGGLVAVCWLVCYLQRVGKPRRDVLWLALAPAGFFVYLGINQWVWHDPLKFLEFQRTAWYHESATPWRGFAIVWRYLNESTDLRSWWYRDLPELIAALLGYGAAVWALVEWRKVGLVDVLYVLGSVVLWTSNTWWMSGLRFCLVLFPLFLLLGSRRWPKWLHQSIWIACVVAQVVFGIAFSVGMAGQRIWAF
jgi:hypothetical protein